MKTFLAAIGAITIAVAVIGSAVAFMGWYDIGADQPHAAPVQAVLNWVRSRSIAANSVAPPSTLPADEKALVHGGEHYAQMCAGCHLAPGVSDRDLHDGLYPRPPDLTKVRVEPKEAFWAIKHGIKMTGMPAWGPTHDDATIWNIVAFIQRLPNMEPSAYAKLTASAAPPSSGSASEGKPPLGGHDHHHH